jgi:hypothetical protein
MARPLSAFISVYLEDPVFREAFMAEPEKTLRAKFPRITDAEINNIKQLLTGTEPKLPYEYDDKLVLCSSAGY